MGSLLTKNNDELESSQNKVKWTKISQEGDIPTARRGHSSWIIEDYKYVFGGMLSNRTTTSDLWRCKLPVTQQEKNVIWEKIETIGEEIAPRCGHRCEISPFDSSKVFLFGGWDGADKFYDELYLFDSTENTWTLCEVKDDIKPPPLSEHQTWYTNEGKYLWVWGGVTSDHVRVNCCWRLDLSQQPFAWENITTSFADNSPSPRSHHTITKISESFYIMWGGFTQGGIELAELWYLYLNNNSIDENISIDDSQLDDRENKLQLEWSEIKIKDSPFSCIGHNSVLLNNNTLVLYNPSSVQNEPIYLYNIEEKKWTNIVDVNNERALNPRYPSSSEIIKCNIEEAPQPRWWSSLLHWKDNQFLLFGGYNVDLVSLNDFWVLTISL